jgi:hypothetical protein
MGTMWILALCAAFAAMGIVRAGQLQEILAQASGNIERMPNYTCLETIERTRRGDPCPKCSIADRVRLEVGVIGGKERFVFPGGSTFEDKEIDELVSHWAIGSGEFAMFPRDLFVSHLATYSAQREEVFEGKAELRYDYTVPPSKSGYRIRSNGQIARVGYHGSFWVDAATLELRRLEVRANNIPPQLLIASANTTIRYAAATTGSGRFLLPQTADWQIVGLDGTGQTNQTRYTACREFVGQSELSFDARRVAVTAAPDPAALQPLPPGLKLEAQLVRPIRMADAAVGDPVEAVVTKCPKRSGDGVQVQKGSRLRGRILRLEIHDSGVRLPATRTTFPAYTVVALQFSSLETDGHEAGIHALLNDYSGVWQGSDGRSRIVAARDPAIQDRGEAGILFFKGALLEIKKGFGIRLITTADE